MVRAQSLRSVFQHVFKKLAPFVQSAESLQYPGKIRLSGQAVRVIVSEPSYLLP